MLTKNTLMIFPIILRFREKIRTKISLSSIFMNSFEENLFNYENEI